MPAMAIYKLIANGSFGPEEIKIMTEAYERALIDLGIDRNDPLTEPAIAHLNLQAIAVVLQFV